MQRLENLKHNFDETLFLNPENYVYWTSLSVGLVSIFCKLFVDMLILGKESCEAPIITFTISTCCALYYFSSSDDAISFKNYKIDYNHSLGKGRFGQVYALVPRPENEQGYLSNLFPYFYDYYFPINNENNLDAKKYCNKDDSEKYCVKVYSLRTTPHCIIENIRERLEEKQSNRVLSMNGMTNIKFYTSNCLFSQIKTRILGQTLDWHLANHSLMDPENYTMREKFVLFYRSLSYSSLTFQDMNSGNIMYDSQKKRWEIIDGIVEDNSLNENIAYKFFSRFTRSLERTLFLEKFDSSMSYLFEKNENSLFMLLRQSALSHEEYTREKDFEILENCAKQLLTPSKL